LLITSSEDAEHLMAWLSCPCPACGHKAEYIPEQVGATEPCAKCRRPFVLPPNDGRLVLSLAWSSVWAVFVVGLYVLVGIDFRPDGPPNGY
jgi:hypothetical protein